MRNALLKTLPVVAILAGIAFATNPDADRHRDQIKEQLSERSQLSKVLLVGPLTAFVSEYHSIGVASWTKIDERTVSVGAFGMVFVRDPSE